MENKPMRSVFCANCQTVTPHSAEVDVNGEFVFTCMTEGCGRFIKLPPDTTPEAAEEYFMAHQGNNAGQVSLAPQQEKLQGLVTPSNDKVVADVFAEGSSPEVQINSENDPDSV